MEDPTEAWGRDKGREEKRREGSESIGFLRYVSDLRSVPLDRCDRSGTSYDEEGMYRNEKK